MPIFNFYCEECKTKEKRLLPKRPEAPPECPACGKPRVFDVNVASLVVETFDNGFMTKKVERPRDIEQLKHDRQKQYLSTKNGGDDIV